MLTQWVLLLLLLHGPGLKAARAQRDKCQDAMMTGLTLYLDILSTLTVHAESVPPVSQHVHTCNLSVFDMFKLY